MASHDLLSHLPGSSSHGAAQIGDYSHNPYMMPVGAFLESTAVKQQKFGKYVCLSLCGVHSPGTMKRLVHFLKRINKQCQKHKISRQSKDEALLLSHPPGLGQLGAFLWKPAEYGASPSGAQ